MEILFNGGSLSKNIEKLPALFKHSLPDEEELSNDDVTRTIRLGRSGHIPRILKVQISEEDPAQLQALLYRQERSQG